MESQKCLKLRQALKRAITRKDRFTLEAKAAVESKRGYRYINDLKIKLSADLLVEKKVIWPYERTLPLRELKRQYNQLVDVFIDVGLIQDLGSGEIGRIGFGNQKLPFPELGTIIKTLREQVPRLRPKMLQGFSQLLIFPDSYAEMVEQKLEQALRIFYNHDPVQNQIKYSKMIDQKQTIKRSTRIYPRQDLSKVTFVGSFGGSFDRLKVKKKLQLLTPGWRVVLAEETLALPKNDTEKTLNHRRQLEKGKTPDHYQSLLHNDQAYRLEEGLSFTDWLTWVMLEASKGIDVLADPNQVFILLKNRGERQDTIATVSWIKSIAGVRSEYGIDINQCPDNRANFRGGAKTVVPIYKYE